MQQMIAIKLWTNEVGDIWWEKECKIVITHICMVHRIAKGKIGSAKDRCRAVVAWKTNSYLLSSNSLLENSIVLRCLDNQMEYNVE